MLSTAIGASIIVVILTDGTVETDMEEVTISITRV